MNWKIIISVFVGAILLRIFGFLPSIWLIFGFVILVWFWDFLLKSFASQKRLINWFLGIFLALSLIFTVGLNIYQKYIEPSTPLTRAALERAKTEKDLEIALRLNPTLLKSRLEIVSQLQVLQDKLGVQDSEELAALKDQRPEEALKETIAILKKQKQYREDIENAMADLSPSQPKKSDSSSFSLPSLDSINKNTVAGIAVLVLFLGLGLILFKKKGVGVKLLWIGGITLALLVVWQIISPSITVSSRNRMFTEQQAGQPSQWSNVTFFDLNPGQTIDTGIPYGPGDVITFYQPNDLLATFYFVGQKITTEIKEKSRTLYGLPPPGDVWLKAGVKPVRVAVSVHRR